MNDEPRLSELMQRFGRMEALSDSEIVWLCDSLARDDADDSEADREAMVMLLGDNTTDPSVASVIAPLVERRDQPGVAGRALRVMVHSLGQWREYADTVAEFLEVEPGGDGDDLILHAVTAAISVLREEWNPRVAAGLLRIAEDSSRTESNRQHALFALGCVLIGQPYREWLQFSLEQDFHVSAEVARDLLARTRERLS